MNWPLVNLGDVCEFKYGRGLAAGQRDGGKHAVYGSNGIVGAHSKAVTTGPTIVIGRKGSFGEVTYSTDACWPIDTTYYVDATSTQADLKWLSYRLRALGLTGLNRAAAVPGLNREDAYRQPLLLPPLGEQRRIAVILDHAGLALSRLRQVVAELDALTQSTYVEMFGSPVDAALNRRSLGEVGGVVTGNTPSRADSANFGDGLEWVKSDNLGGLVATEAEERLSAAGEKSARVAPEGSVLVTCIAGSPQSIGKASLVDRRVAFNQQINAVIPGRELMGRFLLEQLRVAPSLVRQKSSGGMKGLVSKSNFASIQIHVPDMALQRRFVDRANRINDLSNLALDAVRRGDALLSSLQSRAFSGQL